MKIRRNINSFVILCFFILTASACSILPKPSQEVVRQAQIEQFYQKWQGTSYGFGSSSEQAIDCSALMVHAYRDIYGIQLPRTTEHQSDLGKRIRQKKLQAGDLVFFKTGFNQRHVGIYIEDGYFVHASKSSGVQKSQLNSGYWADRYWKSKRIARN